jgi:hypothetical protein
MSRGSDFIRTVNPHAFFSVEDVRYVNEGVLRPKKHGVLAGIFGPVLHPKKEIIALEKTFQYF